jgi:hypothetical protein
MGGRAAAVVVRVLTNTGDLPINFTTEFNVPGLSVAPAEGILEPGKSRSLKFLFRPVDELVHNEPLVIHTDVTPSLALEVWAAGGVPCLVFSNVPDRVLDWGRSLVGRDVIKELVLENTGNAVLHGVNVRMPDASAFKPGPNFPVGRFDLPPGKSRNLPIAFHPTGEATFNGHVICDTANGAEHTIELMGTGRHAHIAVDKARLEFSQCLVGNTYVSEVVVSNVGELSYPVFCSSSNADDFSLSVRTP